MLGTSGSRTGKYVSHRDRRRFPSSEEREEELISEGWGFQITAAGKQVFILSDFPTYIQLVTCHMFL